MVNKYLALFGILVMSMPVAFAVVVKGTVSLVDDYPTAQEYHELKNRYMHIDFENECPVQSAKNSVSKCQNGTLELSLEELAILKIIKIEPSATQKRIAELSGKSERTIKTRTVEMQGLTPMVA